MRDIRKQLAWRLGAVLRPPVTFGVRCLAADRERRIVLVRHTYMAGWHIPGGGVEPGESAREAAAREFREETGLQLADPPTFFGLYWNRQLAGRDHVALFVALDCPDVSPDGLRRQATEIAEVALFPIDSLPEGATPATRRRIEEVFGGGGTSDLWA